MSKSKNVSLLVMGVVIGIVMTMTFSAVAAGRILSAEYNEVTVSLGGEALNLQTPLISVIDEATPEYAANYMPLRAVLEALGYDIKWDGAIGNIDIIAKDDDATEEIAAPTTNPAGEDFIDAPEQTLSLPEIQDRTDRIEFAEFCFLVNGEEVNNDTLAGLSIYRITASVVNSAGTASEATYSGYKLADVLAACGIEDVSKVTAVVNDGYKTEIEGEGIFSDYLLVAIEKDRETGDDGTIWIAPCDSQSSRDYCKLVVEILAD